MLCLVSKDPKQATIDQETEDQSGVIIMDKEVIMHAIALNRKKPMHKQFVESQQDPKAKDV